MSFWGFKNDLQCLALTWLWFSSGSAQKALLAWRQLWCVGTKLLIFRHRLSVCWLLQKKQNRTDALLTLCATITIMIRPTGPLSGMSLSPFLFLTIVVTQYRAGKNGCRTLIWNLLCATVVAASFLADTMEGLLPAILAFLGLLCKFFGLGSSLRELCTVPSHLFVLFFNYLGEQGLPHLCLASVNYRMVHSGCHEIICCLLWCCFLLPVCRFSSLPFKSSCAWPFTIPVLKITGSVISLTGMLQTRLLPFGQGTTQSEYTGYFTKRMKVGSIILTVRLWCTPWSGRDAWARRQWKRRYRTALTSSKVLWVVSTRLRATFWERMCADAVCKA